MANFSNPVEEYNTFEVGFSPKTNRTPWGYISRWQMGQHPLWLNFSDPTILNLHMKASDSNWPSKPDLAVVTESNANTAESWIYLMITATKFPFSGERRIDAFVPAAHPVCTNSHSTLQATCLSRTYVDPSSRPRLRHPQTVKNSILVRFGRYELRQSTPPRRRPSSRRRLPHHRLQSRQPWLVATALPYRMACELRTSIADYGARKGYQRDDHSGEDVRDEKGLWGVE